MITVKGVKQIKGDDQRLVESCMRFLVKKGFLATALVDSGNEGAKIINQLIGSLEYDAAEKNQLVHELLSEAKQTLLRLEEFDWLHNNDRACFWAWRTISQPWTPIVQYNQLNNFLAIHPLPYNNLNLKLNPASSKERLEEIVKFFDRIEQPLPWKKLLLDALKAEWAKIYGVRKPFTWLKADDSEQCEWAWNYISTSNPTSDFSTPSTCGLTPVNQKERYLAIYAAYDCWNTHPDTKKIFCLNFNKAWHQKKHRDSRQGKKACNLVLTSEAKAKLDQMAQEQGITLNRLVETLIENEYSKKWLQPDQG